MQVNLENSKYTLILDEVECALMVNHNGGHWANYTGNKLVYSLMARIIELESAINAYANPNNWAYNDGDGVKRCWKEPESYSPEAYNGFELAQKVSNKDK